MRTEEEIRQKIKELVRRAEVEYLEYDYDAADYYNDQAEALKWVLES